MKHWYSFYYQRLIIGYQPGSQLDVQKGQQLADQIETEKSHQVGGQLEMPEYGSGFGIRQLEQSRQSYRLYPIANTLRSQLNWSQYRRLIQIDDPAIRAIHRGGQRG